MIKFGLNHITKLVEERKAKLVVIASDVDPIELVVWLPTLCRKMDIPYCFVKGKATLGRLVHQKNAAALALCEVRKEVIYAFIQDEAEFKNITEAYRSRFNDNADLRKKLGGGLRGSKSEAKYRRVEAEKEREVIKQNK